jgi:hypothetical protein
MIRRFQTPAVGTGEADSNARTEMRGRRPKPTRLKVLTGNPGKRRLNATEPKPEARRNSAKSLGGNGIVSSESSLR